MYDLFRFIMVRPAQDVPEIDALSIQATTQFQGDVAKGLAGPHADRRVGELVTAFERSADFVSDPSDLSLAKPLLGLAEHLASIRRPNAEALRQTVRDLLGVELNELVANQQFKDQSTQLFDSLVAIKLDKDAQTGGVSQLVDVARMFALLARASTGDSFADAHAIERALSLPLLLPAQIFPVRKALGEPSHAGSVEAQQDGEAAPPHEPTNHERLARVEDALQALLATPHAGLVPYPDPIPSALPSPKQGSTRRSLFGGAVPLPIALNGGGSPDRRAVAPAPSQPQRDQAPLIPLALTGEAAQRLDATTRDTLQTLRLSATATPLPDVISSLVVERDRLQRTAVSPQTMDGRRLVTKLGGTFVELAPGQTSWTSEAHDELSPPAPPQPLPTTRGTLQPVGVADLLVVKENLKRYEAGEISYIQNVLKGESNHREARRTDTNERITVTEEERTTEEEKDLQATQRFELKRETENVLKEDSSLKAGLSLSGSYGPMVDFKSNLDFASNTSQQDSTKQASTYSKDVTTRAASKVTERKREQQTVHTVEVFDELSKHGIDNSGGTGPVVGIYQWVDNVHEAQVFNYGTRMLFDVMVPEPAAFLARVLTSQLQEGKAIVKPDPFTIRPTDLTASSYSEYVAKYQATGVDPPPAEQITIAKTLDSEGGGGDVSASTAEVPIPAGYRAMAADVMYDVASYDGGGTDFHLSIGGQNPQLIGADVWRTVLPGEEQALAIATFGLYQPGFSMAIEIWCARTARAYEEWQNKTYSAIMQSYLRLLSEYEDKLAELAAQEGPITGRDSLLNRVLEQTELKKACIALFTGQQFDSFESMALSPEDLPEMNLAQVGVEGPYVRFFEQALEWDQVMYFFYPYYWNEKPNWRFRILLNDTDPLFAEFLRAGWARVVIPVRPGFAEAVGHFLDTGEVWNGGDLPNVTSPFYLSIIQELKESEGAPGLEVPQGDPWDVRLPTSLVLLKKDDTLPSWHKDPQGNWVPD